MHMQTLILFTCLRYKVGLDWKVKDFLSMLSLQTSALFSFVSGRWRLCCVVCWWWCAGLLGKNEQCLILTPASRASMTTDCCCRWMSKNVSWVYRKFHYVKRKYCPIKVYCQHMCLREWVTTQSTHAFTASMATMYRWLGKALATY